MNVTIHAMERYCQKILDMIDNKEIKKYINENREKLSKEVLELKNNSKHIYFGVIGDNTPKNFYIVNNICMVCSEKDDSIITLIKLEYGFTDEINQSIIDGLLREIDKTNEELEQIKNEITVKLPKKQAELSLIDKEIRIIEEQLKILKDRKANTEEEVNLFSKRIEYNNLQKEKHVNKLVYSINYKTEFVNGKSNGNAVA